MNWIVAPSAVKAQLEKKKTSTGAPLCSAGCATSQIGLHGRRSETASAPGCCASVPRAVRPGRYFSQLSVHAGMWNLYIYLFFQRDIVKARGICCKGGRPNYKALRETLKVILEYPNAKSFFSRLKIKVFEFLSSDTMQKAT